MIKIEMGKQYRTRDGKEVRIYAVDGSSCNDVADYPTHHYTSSPRTACVKLTIDVEEGHGL